MKKTKKIMVLILALLVGIQAALPVYADYNAEESGEEDEGFVIRNGIQFGDTFEEVKEKEIFDLKEADMATYENGKCKNIDTEYGDLSGFIGYVSFYFDENEKLEEVEYKYADQKSESSIISQYETVYNELVTQYGTPLDSKKDGQIYMIFGTSMLDALINKSMYSLIGGVADIDDYDEWTVKYNNYNVKIDMVRSYYGITKSNVNYYLSVSYKLYHDEDTVDSEQQTEEGQKEILFRDIPWGSSAYDVVDALSEEVDDLRLTYDDIESSNYASLEWEIVDGEKKFNTISEIGFYIFPHFKDFTVAGLNVDNIVACFMYTLEDGEIQSDPEDSYFYKASYSFDVLDMALAFEGLKRKMTSLYGEPETGTDSFDDTSSTYVWDWAKWTGDNNTGAILEYNYIINGDTKEEKNLSLDYGITNSYELAIEVQEAMENQKLKEEEEQAQNEDVSGL